VRSVLENTPLATLDEPRRPNALAAQRWIQTPFFGQEVF
jgi:hypothetical protein